MARLPARVLHAARELLIVCSGVARDTWFLLRGLTREAAHWGDFREAFARALPDADVQTLDLPGAGVHHRAQWPATVAEAMERVRREARIGDGRSFVFGVSLGGMVAMEWAARYPAELAGVVIGASSAGDLSPPWKRMRPRALLSLLRGGEARIVRTIINHRERWHATTAAWLEIARQRQVSRANAAAQLRSAIRWRAPQAMPVPALFLVGTTDRLVHADCSRALARRYSAPLVEHATAGHDLTTDAGDWVIDEIQRWRAQR
jgi:pimeloyl-ACP methyl ester carboxylesterase